MTAAHDAAQVSDMSHLALESNRVGLRERASSLGGRHFIFTFAARAALPNRLTHESRGATRRNHESPQAYPPFSLFWMPWRTPTLSNFVFSSFTVRFTQ